MVRGQYLLRWIQVINIMIDKKIGVLELDELRVIHLFEADFNLLVGLIFGRSTVHNAVNNQQLHLSQYGKKGGECMDAAVSKVENGLVLYLVTSEVTSGLRLYPGSSQDLELRVT
jgi:hypothetical protein